MDPSAEACRAQVAIELARAADSPLVNVRSVAERSALAWGKQVLFAEARERRRETTRLTAVRLTRAKEFSDAGAIRTPSENPDRGFARL
jgi:hypothetical protein